MNRLTIPILKLSWNGEYKVNKPGDQSGRYVRLEDMDKLLDTEYIQLIKRTKENNSVLTARQHNSTLLSNGS